MIGIIAEIGSGTFITLAVVLIVVIFLLGFMIVGELSKIRERLERIADAQERKGQSQRSEPPKE